MDFRRAKKSDMWDAGWCQLHSFMRDSLLKSLGVSPFNTMTFAFEDFEKLLGKGYFTRQARQNNRLLRIFYGVEYAAKHWWVPRHVWEAWEFVQTAYSDDYNRELESWKAGGPGGPTYRRVLQEDDPGRAAKLAYRQGPHVERALKTVLEEGPEFLAQMLRPKPQQESHEPVEPRATHDVAPHADGG